MDEVSTRYVEFKATCPADYNYAVDKISYYLSGRGGSAVSYHAYYSTDKDFSTPVLMDEKVNMAKDAPTLVEYSLAEQLEEGQSIYVRLYPWYNGQSAEATGKYLCVAEMTIHGTATKAGGQAIDIAGSVAYPLVDAEPTFAPESMAVGFSGKNVTYGSQLTVSDNGGLTWSGSTDNGKIQTKVYNGSGSSLPSSPAEGNTITYTLNVEDGLVFLPSKVSFQAARYGTDGGIITAKIGGTGEAVICENAAINRSGKGLELATLSAEVSGVSADAQNPLKLAISVLGLGNTKSVGLNDIVIEGQLMGTLQQSTKYTLAVSVQPEDAGTVTQDPAMDSYKEGTEVSLLAKRNFGYQFKEWQVDGATVSSEQAYTLTMDANKVVTAVFTPIPVYTVTASCTNDAERSMGSVTLTPNDHEGRYEAGTVITATANESRILKFMQWTDECENAGTQPVRQLTVNDNMTLVANYEVQDFVAVFDASLTQAYAYPTTASYPFPADVAWDENRNASACVVRVSDGSPVYSQNTGTPVVRNRTGVVLAGINGLYQNGYDTRDIAWQYQFSTQGFTQVTFNADMAAKNAATKSYKAQYSIDGKTYTDINGATWDVTANVIVPVSFALPAEANGQPQVSVRITGVGDELLSTAYNFTDTFDNMKYTTNSESGVGNVYVLGTAEVVADDVAPEITNTLPVNNAQGVSASGKITVSFNERIQAGDTSVPATLSGKTLSPTWNTRSVSFNYNSLDYGATYTFTLPEGYVNDRSGNASEGVTITFTVMEKQKPAARIFDAVV